MSVVTGSVVAATTNPFEAYGETQQLSEDDLKKLAASSVGKSIYRNFDEGKPKLGTINEARVENSKLIVNFVIDGEEYEKCVGSSLVVSYNEKDMEIKSFGLTDKPCDKTVSVI